MKLETVNGKKLLTTKDPQGKLLFSGPVETKEDLDKVPADVRQRYESLRQNDLPAVTPQADADKTDGIDADDDDDGDDEDEGESPAPLSEQVSLKSLSPTFSF